MWGVFSFKTLGQAKISQNTKSNPKNKSTAKLELKFKNFAFQKKVNNIKGQIRQGNNKRQAN